MTALCLFVAPNTAAEQGTLQLCLCLGPCCVTGMSVMAAVPVTGHNGVHPPDSSLKVLRI